MQGLMRDLILSRPCPDRADGRAKHADPPGAPPASQRGPKAWGTDLSVSGKSSGVGRGCPVLARQAAELAAASMASGVGWGLLCANATRRSATANCSRVSPLPSAGLAAFTLFQICTQNKY